MQCERSQSKLLKASSAAQHNTQTVEERNAYGHREVVQ
jgi:hypothetical protein